MEGIKKVLVVTLSNIGDAVLTFPVIGALQEKYSSAEIDVVAGPRARELFEADPRIHKMYIYDKSVSLVSKAALLSRLRGNKYDLLVDLRNSLFGLFVNARYCNKPAGAASAEVCHKIDEHLAKIKDLGIPAGSKPYPVWISNDDAEKAARIFNIKGITDADKIVCVSPGAKSHIKRWTEAGFAKVCDRLISEYKVKAVFIGDDTDKEICERVISQMKNYAISAAGLTNLRELAWIIKRAQLIITNDSAPLHIAGSVGTPAVAVFGPTDYRKYGPREGLGTALYKKLHCSPCEVAACKYNLECMKAVTAEEVFEAAEKILDERR